MKNSCLAVLANFEHVEKRRMEKKKRWITSLEIIKTTVGGNVNGEVNWQEVSFTPSQFATAGNSPFGSE